MSEEPTMDKNKNQTRNATGAKGAIEKSKQSDSLRFGRNGKNRNNYHVRQDNSNNKKPLPQKGKGFDKRPRQRSFYGTSSERDQQITEQCDAEIGSAQNPGSKKINLNHLLNFKYDSRREDSVGHHMHDRIWRYTRKRTFSKEQFLQANCKFVVKDSGDYTIHKADPDILVDWSLIEEIRATTSEIPNCPICLFPPQAAKITRCGHIYCWPCILHYLALSNKTWRKCPICDELIKKDDLKSVKLQNVKSYNVGDEIKMQLMFKQRGSVEVKPVIGIGEESENSEFHKLITMSLHEVIENIIKREEDELNALYAVEGNCPEACFIQEALQLLDIRKKNNRLADIGDINVVSDLASSPEETIDCPPNPDAVNAKVVYANAFDDQICEDLEQMDIKPSEDEDTPKEISVQIPNKEMINYVNNSRMTQKPKELYYFYQSADGQPIYMHSLNVKMLVKQFKTLEECPHIITAKIVQIEANTMDDMMRKRLRYLNHLPLHCEFLVVELNFNHNHLDHENLMCFQAEIKKRKQLRQRKARDERKREKIIECEENKKKGLYPSLNVNVESLQHFPACNEFVLHTTDEELEPQNCSLEEDNAVVSNPANQSTSFAQMLLAGKKKPDVSISKLNNKSVPVMENDEDEVSAPDYHQSFSDAIQIAFDNKNLPTNNDEKQSGKKKKGKKKLLFSTNMNRSK